MGKFSVKSVFLAGIFAICAQLWAQNQQPALLTMADTGAYSIIERSDWRRYNNGSYVGLVRHEVRASIVPRKSERENGALLYQGNFFVLQKTLRDMRQSAQAVDAVIPVSFEVRGNGTIIIENDKGYPTMRGFPTFPEQAVTRGFKWRAPGNRVVDPFNMGNPAVIPFVAEYEYRGIEQYKDIEVHRIYATYASRYQNTDPQANGFSRVQGSHKVDILIRVEDGLPLFMRDDLDETFTLADGSTVQFRGFTLTFGEGRIPMDRGDVIASLGNILHTDKPAAVTRPDQGSSSGPVAVTRQDQDSPPEPAAGTQPGQGPIQAPGVSDSPDTPTVAAVSFTETAIDLTPVPEGIRLTVRDIRFAPDSADFLPEERHRLDLIAEALRQVPERTFLVEGHTAATGRPSGEMELSIARAQRMVDELVRRGISADRFIYKGWGGTKPIGDNSDDSGRSVNRRVEITILE